MVQNDSFYIDETAGCNLMNILAAKPAMGKTPLSPRTKLMRMLHAEAAKRGLSHEDLRSAFGVESLSKASDADLTAWLRNAGKRLRSQPLPRAGDHKKATVEFLTEENRELLDRAFESMGWDADTRRGFIMRQIKRDKIYTNADFHRVFSGIRGMQRRTAKSKGVQTS